MLQGVSGVGIWVKSEDREARWSQWVRASTQPDSDPSGWYTKLKLGCDDDDDDEDDDAICPQSHNSQL